eukprot:m51a1_g7251 hypothetical protein (847) ;mRNA; r:141491-145268
MFRLTELLRLDGLHRLLPEGQLPGAAARPRAVLDAPAHAPLPAPLLSMVAVGQEPGGVLLFACVVVTQRSPSGEQVEMRTYINAFDVKTRRFEQLFVADEHLDVVWATTNSDRSVLGMTVKYRNGSDNRDLYDTVITYVSGGCSKQSPWLVTEHSELCQRIQFVHEEASKSDKVAHFVVFLGHERVVLVSSCAARRGSPLRVEATVVELHAWAQLCQRTGVLYYVASASPRDRSPGAPQALRCVPLLQRRAPRQEFVLAAPLCPQPFAHGASAPLPYDPFQAPEVVALPFARMVCTDSFSCLCVQQDFRVGEDGAPEPFVDVTVVSATHRTRADFRIAVGDVPAAALLRTRAVFDAVADYVVVWVPGHHLRLLDLTERSLCGGLELSGADASPFVEESVALGTRAPYDPLAAPVDLLGACDGGAVLLSARDRALYSYSIDRKRVLELFETPRPELHAELLHAACVHMRDVELVHQVVVHVLGRCPRHATVEFFKEFVSGTTFDALRGAAVPPAVLAALFPSAGPEPPRAPRRRPSESSVASPLSSCSSPSARRLSMMREHHEERGPFLGYLKSLFGGGGTSRIPTREEAQVQSLTAYRLDNLAAKEDRARAAFYAQSFIKSRLMRSPPGQVEEVRVIYHYIKQGAGDLSVIANKLVAFRTLENLYCAAAELAIPLPADFEVLFSQLAFEVLSESVFLQYVERGVVQVTGELVGELQRRGVHESNARLFYHLLCRLPARSVVSAVLAQRQQRMPFFLVEHLLSTRPQLACSAAPVDLAACEASQFIPLSLLLKVVDAQARPIVASGDACWAGVVERASSFAYMAEPLLGPAAAPAAPAAAPAARASR